MITAKIDIYRSPDLTLLLNTISPRCITDRTGTDIYNMIGGDLGALNNGAIFNTTDGSVDLDGVDDYIEFNNPNSFNPDGYTNLSMSVWMKNNTDTGGIIGWYDATIDDNGLEMEIYGGDIYIAFSSSDYGLYSYGATGSWVNFAFTYDGTGVSNSDKLKFYVNGQPVAISFGGTVPSAINASAPTSFVVGLVKSGIGFRYIDGKVGHVLAYNATLTDEQVLQNFNAIRSAYSL